MNRQDNIQEQGFKSLPVRDTGPSAENWYADRD